MLIFIGWMTAVYLLSIYLYSLAKPFSITTVWISALGNPAEDVASVYLFNPGMFLTLFFIVPHYYYLYFRIPIKNTFFKIFSTVLLVLGALGFGLIGAFPDTIQPVHDIVASIYFGAMGVGYVVVDLFYIIYGLRCVMGARVDENQVTKRTGLFIVISAILSLLFLAIGDGTFIVKYLSGNMTGIVIWEWLAFFSTMANLLLVAFFLDPSLSEKSLVA